MKLSNVLPVISLVGLGLGLGNVGSPSFSGICLALGAVFFIVSFAVRAVENAEATSEEQETQRSPERTSERRPRAVAGPTGVRASSGTVRHA